MAKRNFEDIGLPRTPIVLDGTEIVAVPSNGLNDPQNLWFSIERNDRWAAANILGMLGDDSYLEPDTLTDDMDLKLAEADLKRQGDEKYTDQRGLDGFGVFLGHDISNGTHRDRLVGEFRKRSVLDIGSGGGRLAEDLRRDAKARVTEIDFSASVLDSLDPPHKGRGERIVGDGTDMSMIEDGSFERSVSVYSTSVHTDTVSGRLKGLSEQLRVTEVDGTAITVPLFGGVVLRADRWHKLHTRPEIFAELGEEAETYKATLRQEAAMDHALVSFVRDLMLEGFVELTPHVEIYTKPEGQFDCVSGIFDIRAPLSRQDATELMLPRIAQFKAI